MATVTAAAKPTSRIEILSLVQSGELSIDDAANADRTFDMLMGSAVPPRTRFITTHAHAVRNLDI